MSNSFSGLTTAITGMYSNQKALEVTGHNVSNLNTAGYTRQQAILATANSQYIVNNWVEMGSRVQEIRQIRNAFLDSIYRKEANGLGYWEARYNSVKDLEAILGEPMTDGLQNTLNEFWNSWQELAKSPESLTIRALVRQRAEALVYQMNHIGEQINKLQDDINNEIIKKIDEVNDITKQIAELNAKIAKAEGMGNKANDYYDQRNNLVDRLSELLEVEIYENPNGMMDILTGGYYLVNKTTQTKIVAVQNAALSPYVVPVLEGLGVQLDVGTGAIKGLMESRGMVSGAKGSYENGTPNTTCDITFAVDLSDSSDAYLANLKNNIQNYVNKIKSYGLNYNLRLVTYSAEGINNVDFGSDINGFVEAVNNLTASGGAATDFGSVVSSVANTAPFSESANRYMVVFTSGTLTGSESEINGYIKTLGKSGIRMSVIGPGEGWSTVANATGGSVYDISTPADEFASLMSRIAEDTASDVNKRIAAPDESMNIISSVKKMLNAMVNIIVREVNRLHMSGKTLNGNDGGAFFEPINAGIPMEMGNIKLSDSLADLNNIVASASDANGDNTIAKAIADLRNRNIMASFSQTLDADTYYRQIILKVGNVGREAEQYTESQRVLVSAADNDRQSIAGVSLDEEMSNMIKFKYAYNAATRAISVINEMLDTLVNRTGMAGR